MISQLIENATRKAGNQTKLAEILGLTQQRLSAFKNYTTGDKRKPNDETILQLADILGLDKGETLYKAKLELEPEKAHLWQFMVRSAGLEPTPQASETYYPGEVEMIKFILFLITYIIKILPGQITRTNHQDKSSGQISWTNHQNKSSGQITRTNHLGKSPGQIIWAN